MGMVFDTYTMRLSMLRTNRHGRGRYVAAIMRVLGLFGRARSVGMADPWRCCFHFYDGLRFKICHRRCGHQDVLVLLVIVVIVLDASVFVVTMSAKP